MFFQNAYNIILIEILYIINKGGKEMNKEKKKLSLAVKIFIALILAIIAGLLLQGYAEFAENYIKIVNVDKGLIPIELYPYQRRLLLTRLSRWNVPSK